MALAKPECEGPGAPSFWVEKLTGAGGARRVLRGRYAAREKSPKSSRSHACRVAPPKRMKIRRSSRWKSWMLSVFP